MTDNCVRFLHLSDIHFKKLDFDLDTDLRNQLDDDACKLIESRGPLSGILISGDVAFAGQIDEYKIAIDWLEKLVTKLKCTPDVIWCVPGNHDVNRQEIKNSKLLRDMIEKLKSNPVENLDSTIEEYLQDSTSSELLYKSIETYTEKFASMFGCEITNKNPYFEHDFILNDDSILRIRGINSTAVSSENDDDENHRLIIGPRQGTFTTQKGVEYLLFCHHPYPWLKDQEERRAHWLKRVKIQLFGHKHNQQVDQINNSLILTAGAMHPDRRQPLWNPMYNLLEVNTSYQDEKRTMNINVFQRVWKKDEQDFCADYSVEGKEFRDYHLLLDPWISENQNMNAETRTPVNSEPLRTVNNAETAVRKDYQMDATRLLTYRFLRLPFHKRISIANELGLLEDTELGIKEGELFKQIFRKAKQTNILDQLWSKVDIASGNSVSDINPFKK